MAPGSARAQRTVLVSGVRARLREAGGATLAHDAVSGAAGMMDDAFRSMLRAARSGLRSSPTLLEGGTQMDDEEASEPPRPTWPLYVFAAADGMGYDYDTPEGVAIVEALAAEWGGFGPEALLSAIRVAHGEAWLFAMKQLIIIRAPDARDEAVRYLSSTDSLQRWYGAFYLGTLDDRRACPTLRTIPTEFLPSPDAYYPALFTQGRFEASRSSAAYLLGMLGDLEAVPALRQALLATLSIERRQAVLVDETPLPHQMGHRAAVRDLQRGEARIVYALGQLGAFAALTGVDGVDDRLDLWRVHAVMGQLHGRHAVQHLPQIEENAALLAEVTAHLAARFGLTAAEQADHLSRYNRTMLSVLSSQYEVDEMQRAWSAEVVAG